MPWVFKVSNGGLDSLVTKSPKYDQLQAGFPELDDDLDLQQQHLIRDMLVVLNGGEGDHVRFAEQFDPLVLDDRLRGPHYKLAPTINPKLRDIISKVTEIAGNAYVVRTFSEHYSGLEFGKVNQALASAFRVLHLLYLELVAQITPSMGLYAVWVHLEPFAHHLLNAKRLVHQLVEKTRLARERKRLHHTDDLVERASTAHFVAHDEKEALIELRGGAVLRNIAELLRREMGDREACNLYEELIKSASQPYLEMLIKWLQKGELDDTFEEFAVQTTSGTTEVEEQGNVDDYWDKRYSVRAMSLPLQLSQPRVYTQLLVSGKYLNVIKDTGFSVSMPPLALNNCESIEDPQVLEAIAQAYVHANQSLLAALHAPVKLNLKNMFKSLYTVFLTNDVFDLLDSVAGELEKPVTEITLSKLEHAFGVAKDDEQLWSPYVTVKLASETLKDQLLSVITTDDEELISAGSTKSSTLQSQTKLSGYDVLYFDYAVPFPLSVVVTRRAVIRYQFLSRHILELNHTKDMLTKSWVVQVKDPRWRAAAQVSKWVERANLLRQSKLQLIENLVYCSAIEGIQQEFHQFITGIDKHEEVTELAEQHIRFLDKALVHCLLAEPPLIKVLSRLLTLCRQFAKFVVANADTVEYACGHSQKLMTDEEGKPMEPGAVMQWYAETLQKYEHVFFRNLQRFRDLLVDDTPRNYAAGASAVYLIQRIDPLLARYLRAIA